MSRIVTKAGDVFEIHHQKDYMYFQLACFDLTQLNSDVIAVFKGKYKEPQLPEDILRAEVDFFLHTTTRAGVPGLWKKIGKGNVVDASTALFKDVDLEKEEKELNEGPSEHWFVWYPNTEWQYVGSHDKVPENAMLGLVFNPQGAYNRIVNGKFDYPYYAIEK